MGSFSGRRARPGLTGRALRVRRWVVKHKLCDEIVLVVRPATWEVSYDDGREWIYDRNLVEILVEAGANLTDPEAHLVIWLCDCEAISLNNGNTWANNSLLYDYLDARNLLAVAGGV
jgi:hypothetical protein